LREHTSPGWTHHETVMLQLPSTHDCEQQSASWLQELPEVLQAVLSGVQVPSVPQTPPQHSPSAAHASPSEVQALASQVLPLQCKLQQSVGTEQPPPG
jgi:hypothetical protein